MANKLDALERVEVNDRARWRAWLEKHHARSVGVWLVLHKKHRADLHVPVEHVVEEMLCFGWIDSTARPLDADRRMLYVCPRKPKSVWSKVNKERVERLIAARRMMPAGLQVIGIAKAHGSWTALDAMEALEVPPELAKALAKNKPAKKHFEAFPPSARKFILTQIGQAKTDATRAKRIEEAVRLAALNIRYGQPQRTKP